MQFAIGFWYVIKISGGISHGCSILLRLLMVPDLARWLALQERLFGVVLPYSAMIVSYKTIDEVFDQLRSTSSSVL